MISILLLILLTHLQRLLGLLDRQIHLDYHQDCPQLLHLLVGEKRQELKMYRDARAPCIWLGGSIEIVNAASVLLKHGFDLTIILRPLIFRDAKRQRARGSRCGPYHVVEVASNDEVGGSGHTELFVHEAMSPSDCGTSHTVHVVSPSADCGVQTSSSPMSVRPELMEMPEDGFEFDFVYFVIFQNPQQEKSFGGTENESPKSEILPSSHQLESSRRTR